MEFGAGAVGEVENRKAYNVFDVTSSSPLRSELSSSRVNSMIMNLPRQVK
jgi:hypothetical protein